MRIVNIYEYLVRCPAKVVIQLAFGILDSFKRAETKEMSLTHICDKSVIRKSNIYKFLDVTGMACSHLYDSQFRLRIDLEEGQRHADTVVKIALGSRDTILHGQDFTDKLLRGGLAVRSGQSDYCQRLAVDYRHRAVPSCEILQCLQGIFHLDQTRIL